MEFAAGIVIVRPTEQSFDVLCLRIYSHYDLPKGRIEDGESELQAAIRETSEEAGISEVKFVYGYDSITIKHSKRPKQVTFFLGTTKQEPVLTKNPLTGEYEHHGIVWLPIDIAAQRVHVYLRPAIVWAKQKLIGDQT